MSRPHHFPFWRRAQLQVEIHWCLTPATDQTTLSWLFHVETTCKTNEKVAVERYAYPGWYCRRWWYSLFVRVLGFGVGAGIAYVTNPRKE